MFREDRRETQESAAAMLPCALHASPGLASNVRLTVELRQSFVGERVVGAQQFEQRAIALNQVGQEPNRFLVHVLAEDGELGKQPFVLRFCRGEIIHMQSLAAELRCQAAYLGLPEHPQRLPLKFLRATQCAAGSRRA